MSSERIYFLEGDDWPHVDGRPYGAGPKLKALILALVLDEALHDRAILEWAGMGWTDGMENRAIEVAFGEDNVKRARGKKGSPLPTDWIEMRDGCLRVVGDTDVMDALRVVNDGDEPALAALHTLRERVKAMQTVVEAEQGRLKDDGKEPPEGLLRVLRPLREWETITGARLQQHAVGVEDRPLWTRLASQRRLRKWLGTLDAGLFVVHGPPYSGKTSLLDLLDQMEIGVVKHDARAAPTVDALRETIAFTCGVDGTVEEQLRQAAERGRPLAIAIDGLDRHQDRDGPDVHLLPYVRNHAEAPVLGLRIIVAWSGEPPDWARDAEVLDLGKAAMRAEHEEIARQALEHFGREGDPHAAAVDYAAEADGNLRLLVELCELGAEALNESLADVHAAMKRDDGVWRLVAVLTAAKGNAALSQAELLEVVGPIGVDGGQLDRLAARGLTGVQRDGPEGVWSITERLAHDRRSSLDNPCATGHRLLARAFVDRYGDHAAGAGPPSYLERFGLAHLLDAGGDPSGELVGALTNPTLLERRWRAAPHKLAFEIGRVTELLSSSLRQAPAHHWTGDDEPFSVARLHSLLREAVGRSVPDASSDVWSALHDAALNSERARTADEDERVTAWLRRRALADSAATVSLLARREPDHPPALVWYAYEPDARHPPRAVLGVGAGASTLLVLSHEGRLTAYHSKTGERRQVSVYSAGDREVKATAIAPQDDQHYAVGTSSGWIARVAVDGHGRCGSVLPEPDGADHATVVSLARASDTETLALLATADGFHLARVDWAPARPLAEVEPLDAPGLTAVAHEGGRVLAWGCRGALLFDGRRIDLPQPEPIAGVAAGKDALAVLGASGATYLVTVRTGEVTVTSFPGLSPVRTVEAVEALPQGRVALGQSSGWLRICPLARPTDGVDVENVTEEGAHGVACIDPPHYVAAADQNGWLSVVDTAADPPQVRFKEQLPHEPARLQHLTHKQVVTVGARGTDVRVWDTTRLAHPGAVTTGSVTAMCALAGGVALSLGRRLLLRRPADGADEPSVSLDEPAVAIAPTGRTTLLALTNSGLLVDVDFSVPCATARDIGARAIGLVGGGDGRPWIAVATPQGSAEAMPVDGEGSAVALPAGPEMLAVSASGAVASATGTTLTIHEPGGSVTELALRAGCSAMAWAGQERLLVGAAGELLLVSAHISGWSSRPLARASEIRALSYLGKDLVAVSDAQRVRLLDLGRNGMALAVLAPAPGLVAAAPADIEGRCGCLVAMAQRAQGLRWRHVVAPRV